MTTETRTQRYEGLYPSQVQEAYAADARQAAASGWYPTGEQWIGQTLVVTYAPRPATPSTVTVSTPTEPTPTAPRGGMPRVALVIVGADSRARPSASSSSVAVTPGARAY